MPKFTLVLCQFCKPYVSNVVYTLVSGGKNKTKQNKLLFSWTVSPRVPACQETYNRGVSVSGRVRGIARFNNKFYQQFVSVHDFMSCVSTRFWDQGAPVFLFLKNGGRQWQPPFPRGKRLWERQSQRCI